MTAGITKRPADWLEPVARGVVYVALGVVFAVGTVFLASATRYTYRLPGKEWTGNEDMSTSLVRIEGGAHTIRWEAPCVLDVDLWANDGEDVFVEQAGSGTSGSRVMNLPTGYYFLSVGATCDWVASIR